MLNSAVGVWLPPWVRGLGVARGLRGELVPPPAVLHQLADACARMAAGTSEVLARYGPGLRARLSVEDLERTVASKEHKSIASIEDSDCLARFGHAWIVDAAS